MGAVRMSDNARRLNWVDTAKGLSILLVVMMHSAYGVGQETGGTGVLHWVIAFATPFRMPEFFMISGLFLSQVIGRAARPYADRRVVHYFYFYAVWAVIHILFKVALVNRDPSGAGVELLRAVIEPYGVLWFIYMLAVFSAAAKLLHHFKVPNWLVLLLAAGLQMLPVATASGIVNEFAAYFVYFFAGYALAPEAFRLIEWVDAHPVKAGYALALWAVLNAALVFSPGFKVLPDHVEMGLAALPGLHLVLALTGSMALCTLAALLGRLPFMDWLRWLGSKSIVVYLAFALPMGIARTVLVKLGIDDTSLLSIAVLATAVMAPLVLYWLIERTGYGRFLFERPEWAHLPGTPGSKQVRPSPAPVPAE